MRRAREERGLTLQQVEQGTKIRVRYLQGLEREDFGVLPTVYVLGSLKTYADHLGLDGADLSRQLKARLEQPTEPDLSAQLVALRETGDEEYEATPLTAIGFDQLFLGMGAVVISILVVMTVVTASVQGDGSPVSQLEDPSTPETSSEIALAGNLLDEPDRQPRSEGAPTGERNDKDGRDADEKDDQPKNDSGPSKNDTDRPEQEAENASSQDSLFDDVKFVPMSPSSPRAAGAAPSTASPTPEAPSTSTTVAPSSPEPAVPEPAVPEPVVPEPAVPEPDDAWAAPAPVGPTPVGPFGGGAPPRRDDDPPGAGVFSGEVAEKIDEAFEGNGLGE